MIQLRRVPRNTTINRSLMAAWTVLISSWEDLLFTTFVSISLSLSLSLSLFGTLTHSQSSRTLPRFFYIYNANVNGINHIYREEFVNDIILDAKLVRCIMYVCGMYMEKKRSMVFQKKAWITSLVTYSVRMSGQFLTL